MVWSRLKELFEPVWEVWECDLRTVGDEIPYWIVSEHLTRNSAVRSKMGYSRLHRYHTYRVVRRGTKMPGWKRVG